MTPTLTPEVRQAVISGWRPWPGFHNKTSGGYYGGRNEPDVRSSFSGLDDRGDVLTPVWLWDHSQHQSTMSPRLMSEVTPSSVPEYVMTHVEADSPLAWYLNRLASIK